MINKKITERDKDFMRQLHQLEQKSCCIRAQVGAMIIKDDKLLAEGCNDIPHDEYNCNIIGCIRAKEQIPSGHEREVCLGLCAEQYVISKAAERGIPINNSTIYVSTYPCRICCSLIVNSGIKKVVYKNKYPSVVDVDILNDAGVEVVEFTE